MFFGRAAVPLFLNNERENDEQSKATTDVTLRRRGY